jgi:hypothetical protein
MANRLVIDLGEPRRLVGQRGLLPLEIGAEVLQSRESENRVPSPLFPQTRTSEAKMLARAPNGQIGAFCEAR